MEPETPGSCPTPPNSCVRGPDSSNLSCGAEGGHTCGNALQTAQCYMNPAIGTGGGGDSGGGGLRLSLSRGSSSPLPQTFHFVPTLTFSFPSQTSSCHPAAGV